MKHISDNYVITFYYTDNMTTIKPEFMRRIHERAKELGGWKKHGVKTQICREFSISRPTLYEGLKKYPTAVIKKYAEYDDFYKIPQVKNFTKVAKKSKVKRLLKCWLALNRKSPMNWTSEDLAILRKHPELIDPRTGRIKYHILGAVRKFLSLYRPKLYRREEKNLLYTKGTKPLKGSKRSWFLTTNELDKFLSVIDDNIEFFTQTTCQVKWGCRHSALRHDTFTVSQIDRLPETDGNIVGVAHIFEPKTGKPWEKIIDEQTMYALEKYVATNNLILTDKLFPHSLGWYNDRMKKYGMKAGLCKYKVVRSGKRNAKRLKYVSGIPFSSHLLRHTFAFICSINDVPLEETADLGGWEDINTLKDFYYYVPPEKLRNRFNSINWKKNTPRDKFTLVKTRKEPLTAEELKALEGEKE